MSPIITPLIEDMHEEEQNVLNFLYNRLNLFFSWLGHKLKTEELQGHIDRGATMSQSQRSYEVTKTEELRGHKDRGATRSNRQRSYEVTKTEEPRGHKDRGATRSQRQRSHEVTKTEEL